MSLPSPCVDRVLRLAAVCACSLLSATAIAQPSGARAAGPQTVEAEATRLSASIETERNAVVALANAYALERLRPFMSQADYAERLTALAARTQTAQTRFVLLRHAARARLEVADLRHGKDGMQGPLGEQGCLTGFSVVGPFENASMQGFHAQLGPETGEPGPYEGKMAEIDWRDLSSAHQLCHFNLNNVIRPSTAAVSFMASQLDSPRAEKAALLVGAQGAYRIWLNGKLVGERTEERGLGVDNDAWNIALARGENDLVIKMGSTGQGGLGAIVRLVDAKSLAPLKSVRQRPVWTSRALEAEASTRLDANAQGVLAEIVRTARAPAASRSQRAWAAWLWSQQHAGDTSTPWRDVAETLIATIDASSASLEPRLVALMSELFAEHWRRLDLLTRAHKLAPADAWIGVRLAREYGQGLSDSQEFERRDLLERIVSEQPQFLVGRVELADWYSQNDLPQLALAQLSEYSAPDRMQVVTFARRMADWTEQVASEREARVLREQVMKISTFSGLYLWREVRELAARGRVDEALAIVRDQRGYFPWSLQWGLQEVSLLRAAGHGDEALTELDRLIEMVPGEAQLLEQRAQLLSGLGQFDEAIETVERALVLKPQDQNLHEFLAFLRPDADRFYEPFIVADVRALAAEHAAGPFSYDTIVDQSVVRVAPNGLAQQAVQRVERVITPEGVDTARRQSISYRVGDERVEVLRVRVHKADGTISEDFDQWNSGSARKRTTTYNDTSYVNVRANNVDPGDLVEFRYVVHQIANENFRGDYFGDVTYVQGPRPIAFLRYAVIYPKSWELHFRAPAQPHTRIDDKLPNGEALDDARLTSFELRDVKRVKTDSDQPGFTEVYDHILVSNKKTYDEIGRWWWNLVKEQLVVNDEIRTTVQTLTAGLSTEDQKVRAIYNYVAKNTRYLHVGLGIHGWKPYRTSDIIRNRYGDCKDKAALLKVMLETAGVGAELVLVRTRRLGAVDEYPASMHVFNHAIAYVPSLNVFLDATAEFNGAHELTSMDQGAQALIVNTGGKTRWLTLPVDEAKQNLFRQSFEVDLTGDEPLVRGQITAWGANAVYYRQTLEDPERRDEVLEKQLSAIYPGAKIVSASYKNLDDLDKPTEITVSFTGGRLLQESDARAFIYPYGAPRDLLSSYARQATRTQPLTLRVPFANETSMRYRLPASRSFERIPEPVTMSNRFGSLDIAYRPDGDSLVVDIAYSIDVQRVELADYAEFRQFVSEMTAALNETIGVGAEKR
ncbi:MAG: DUF3857 domain-containing protein [Bradymonadaceae bacterium]|nr:DUF3857 domain-containing protein [Lujinxingiaceae bacterium]